MPKECVCCGSRVTCCTLVRCVAVAIEALECVYPLTIRPDPSEWDYRRRGFSVTNRSTFPLLNWGLAPPLVWLLSLSGVFLEHLCFVAYSSTRLPFVVRCPLSPARGLRVVSPRAAVCAVSGFSWRCPTFRFPCGGLRHPLLALSPKVSPFRTFVTGLRVRGPTLARCRPWRRWAFPLR